ncbi:MAG: hypothetical protein ACJAXS_002779 [Colwellia sp.]|jgi:hypothetical protein
MFDSPYYLLLSKLLTSPRNLNKQKFNISNLTLTRLFALVNTDFRKSSFFLYFFLVIKYAYNI